MDYIFTVEFMIKIIFFAIVGPPLVEFVCFCIAGLIWLSIAFRKFLASAALLTFAAIVLITIISR